MKKLANIIVIIFLPLLNFSQTSKLEMFIPRNTEKYTNEVKYILSSDQIVVNGIVQSEWIEVDSLFPGIYTIEIIKNDTLLFKMSNIVLKEDTVSDYAVCYTEPIYYPIDDGIIYPEMESYFGLLYGPNIYNEDPYTFGSFTCKMGVICNIGHYLKYLNLGYIFGGEVVYTAFNNDTTMYPPTPVKFERYFNFNLNFGFYNRISLYDKYKSESKRGMEIDIGGTYDFPISFRHVYKRSKQKTITKGLHQYNNFSAFCRVGYFPFSFVFEYRIFDFIKGEFPEEPKFKIGITFMYE